MRDHAYIDKTIAKTNDEAMAAMFGKRSALGCIGGVMMSRELIGQTRFRTELTIGEDYYFIYENLIKGTGCAELKERWYFARLHTTNSSFDYSFKGFWSRFYRRVLVWKNEESLGRKNFADIQKKDAFGCYLRCISHIGLFSEDAKKMRKVLKEYKSDILPAFGLKAKIAYILCAYFPFSVKVISKIRRK